MIKGIQIKGKIAYMSENIVYIVNFEEMTVDTERNNRTINSEELEEFIENN